MGAAEGPCATPQGWVQISAAVSASGSGPSPIEAPPSIGQGAAAAIDRWQPLIEEASRRFGVPQRWIREVMRAESGGHAMMGGRPTVSRAGAMGLMQIMPATYEDLRRRHGLGADPHDPRDNILAGAAYLREMWACFGVPGAFAAYHAGPARLAEHLASGRPLPPETRRYLAQLGVRLGQAVEAASPAECPMSPAGVAPEPDRRRVLIVPPDGRDLLVPLRTSASEPER
ncbi:lytic transglycosylase domain-containing protein [Inquilinus limosus]